MSDKEFLKSIYLRMKCMHGENPNVDYMHKLASIINATDKNIDTPNTGHRIKPEPEDEVLL